MATATKIKGKRDIHSSIRGEEKHSRIGLAAYRNLRRPERPFSQANIGCPQIHQFPNPPNPNLVRSVENDRQANVREE